MIYGFVNGQSLRMSQPEIASNTNDYLEIGFIFQSIDWSGLVKWCHLKKVGDTNVYDIKLIGDKVQKSAHLNLDEGTWEIYLHGDDLDGNERVTTTIDHLVVERTGFMCVPFPEIPKTAAQQIMADAEKAKQIAQSVRDDADAGKFNGGPGPAGQGVVKGGTTGQVLAKKSDADYDTEWVNAGSIGEVKAEEVSAVVPVGLPKDTPENVQGVVDTLMKDKQPKDFIVKTNYMDIPNHSSQEIYEAYRAGKNVKLIRNGQEYRLTSSIPARANFKALTFAPTQINQVTVVIEGKQLIAKSVSFTPLAENVTATVPASLPTETEKNVQAVVNALAEKAETNNVELNKKQPKGDYATKEQLTQGLEKKKDVTDNTIGILSAEVGQIAEITSVNEAGQPTGWKAVPKPAGGGGGLKPWRLIGTGTAVGSWGRVEFSTDPEGRTFKLSEVLFVCSEASGKRYVNINGRKSGTFDKSPMRLEHVLGEKGILYSPGNMYMADWFGSATDGIITFVGLEFGDAGEGVEVTIYGRDA